MVRVSFTASIALKTAVQDVYKRQIRNRAEEIVLHELVYDL